MRQIEILGDYVSVKAQIAVFHNLSEGADYREIIEWFSESEVQLKRVFITQDELVSLG